MNRVGNLRRHPSENAYVGSVRMMAYTFGLLVLPAERQSDNPDAPAWDAYTTSGGHRVHLGSGWNKQPKDPNGKTFLSLTLDQPSWPAPLNLTGFRADEGDGFDLVWSRSRAANRPASGAPGGAPASGRQPGDLDDEIPF